MACDLQIVTDAKWDEEIKRKLEEADLYLFLMSTDLLNSNYVQKTELPIARKRHEEDKALLVPVVVRKCGRTDTSETFKVCQEQDARLSNGKTKTTRVLMWRKVCGRLLTKFVSCRGGNRRLSLLQNKQGPALA